MRTFCLITPEVYKRHGFFLTLLNISIAFKTNQNILIQLNIQ